MRANKYGYSLVNCCIAIEHGHRNSGFSQLEMVDLSIVFCKRLSEGQWKVLQLPSGNLT